MNDDLSERVRDAAAAQIFEKRASLLKERRLLRGELAKLSEREQQIEQEIIECKAAAQFFGLAINSRAEETELQEYAARIEYYRLRDREGWRRNDVKMAHHYNLRAEVFEAKVEMIENKETEQGKLPNLIDQTSNLSIPMVTHTKMPKIREIVLDQLGVSGARGLRASQIQNYIETTYSRKIHGKTVGMTLYRLSKELLAHRKGQTWFYGSAEQLMPASDSENPGADTPGELR